MSSASWQTLLFINEEIVLCEPIIFSRQRLLPHFGFSTHGNPTGDKKGVLQAGEVVPPGHRSQQEDDQLQRGIRQVQGHQWSLLGVVGCGDTHPLWSIHRAAGTRQRQLLRRELSLCIDTKKEGLTHAKEGWGVVAVGREKVRSRWGIEEATWDKDNEGAADSWQAQLSDEEETGWDQQHIFQERVKEYEGQIVSK